jgi:triacylglycerol lipase
MLSENSNSDLKKPMKVKNEATSQRISKSAYSIFVLLVAIAIGVAVSSIDRIPSSPVVQLKNGSYYGVHVPEYNTYHFLGMPYAKAPVGKLRYRPPESLNSTWTGVHSATEYGYSCTGYGEDTYDALNNYVSEDCLTLNVIKPAILKAHPPLPVLVWIHGYS